MTETKAAYKTGSDVEDALAWQMAQIGIEYCCQYRAIPGRRYTWDFALLPQRLLIEVQGGTWSRNRSGHSTGAGIQRDCEKLNLATLHGWRVMAFTSDMVHDGSALMMIEKFLRGEK